MDVMGPDQVIVVFIQALPFIILALVVGIAVGISIAHAIMRWWP